MFSGNEGKPGRESVFKAGCFKIDYAVPGNKARPISLPVNNYN